MSMQRIYIYDPERFTDWFAAYEEDSEDEQTYAEMDTSTSEDDVFAASESDSTDSEEVDESSTSYDIDDVYEQLVEINENSTEFAAEVVSGVLGVTVAVGIVVGVLLLRTVVDAFTGSL